MNVAPLLSYRLFWTHGVHDKLHSVSAAPLHGRIACNARRQGKGGGLFPRVSVNIQRGGTPNNLCLSLALCAPSCSALGGSFRARLELTTSTERREARQALRFRPIPVTIFHYANAIRLADVRFASRRTPWDFSANANEDGASSRGRFDGRTDASGSGTINRGGRLKAVKAGFGRAVTRRR